MTTPIRITGWEQGLATPVTNGGGLANTVQGTVSVWSTTKRTGGYALRCVNSATAPAILYNITGTSTTQITASFYIYFVSLPTSSCSLSYPLQNAGGYIRVRYNSATQKLALYNGTTTTDIASVTTGVWYRVDVKWDCSANPNTCSARVDGGTEQSLNIAQAATYFSRYDIGLTSAAVGGEACYDDLIISSATADYPIGAHAVIGLRPSVDGTHNAGTNVMEDSAGNDIHATNFPAYSYLDENPWTSEAAADRVQQTANGTGNYCEVLFADTTETNILGAMAYLQYASAAATANNGGCVIIDEDGTNTTLWGAAGALADYSESSAFYKSVILPTPAGGWDTDAVNALKARFGYSSDAAPDPYWLAMMLEVAYSESASDDLISEDIVTEPPILATTTIGQTHVLSANNITSGIPVLDASALGQTHILSANDITSGIPVLDAPNLELTHELSANDILSGIPVLDAPTIGQTHALDANDILSGILLLDAPTIGQTHVLDANDILSGISVLGAPNLELTHELSSNDILSGIPVLDAPTIGQMHILDANDILSGIPLLDAPTIGQTHVLDSTDITSGIPVLDAPTIGQTHVLDSTDILSGIPLLDAPTISQTHILDANDILSGIPVLDAPTLTEVEPGDLIATDIISGIPELGAPYISQTHILISNNIESGNPILDSPTLAEIHTLISASILTGPVILETPYLGQTHVLLGADIYTDFPILGTPIFRSTSTPTLASRMYIIHLENRIFIVEDEDRISKIQHENRFLDIDE